MKFKVGDKVRIKPDLKIDEGNGNWTATGAMLQFRGEAAVIREVESFGCYSLDIDDDEFGWVDEMLIPFVELQCPADCNADNFVVISGSAVSITNNLSYFKINNEKFEFCPACGTKLKGEK